MIAMFYIASPSASSVIPRIRRFGTLLLDTAAEAEVCNVNRLPVFTDKAEATKHAEHLGMKCFRFKGKTVTYANAAGEREKNMFGKDFVAVFPRR